MLSYQRRFEKAWVAAYGQLAAIFIKIESDLYKERAHKPEVGP